MTPQQRQALEGIHGAPLSAQQIEAIDPLLDWDNRDDVAIAALLSSWQQPVMRSLTVDQVFDILFAAGEYSAMKQAQLAGDPRAVMAFALLMDAKQLGSGTVNLQLQATIDLLDSLQAEPALLTQAGRTALTTAATADAPAISVSEVSDALNLAEGRLTL